jgi:uncharacterized ion transporter superfamily protein YfcC
MLYGVFRFGWYINEISAVFLMVTILAAVLGRLSVATFSDTVFKSISVVAPGAFMVGFATAIKVAWPSTAAADCAAWLRELLR